MKLLIGKEGALEREDVLLKYLLNLTMKCWKLIHVPKSRLEPMQLILGTDDLVLTASTNQDTEVRVHR